MILLIALIIFLISYILLLCSYYSMSDDIDNLPKSFVMKYIYRLISCNKVLSHLITDIHPIFYFFTIGTSSLVSIMLFLKMFFK